LSGGIRFFLGIFRVITIMIKIDERIDEVDKHYRPVQKLDLFSGVLFYVGALLSISIPFLSGDGSIFGSIVPILFFLTVFLRAIIVGANSYYFIPFAERQRRRQFLSNSLAIPLTAEETNKYYNNDLGPNVIRLGANLMENSFFGKHICERMLVIERLKVITYGVVWLLVTIYRGSDLGLVLAISHLVFASEIVFKWVRLEILRARNERVFDSLYSLYLGRPEIDMQLSEAAILDAFAEYESSKASASIKLSTKVFLRINEDVTGKWERVKTKIKI